MSEPIIIVTHGTGRFPLYWLTALQAWPRTEDDARAIAQTIGIHDPRIDARVFLATDRPPHDLAAIVRTSHPRWEAWIAAPRDIPPERERFARESPCRGPAR